MAKATAKQLAALKRARAARKRNLAKKAKTKSPVSRTRKTSTRKTARKSPRRTNPTYHAIEITNTRGQKGYLSKILQKTVQFDSTPSKAKKLALPMAKALNAAISQMKGVRSARVVKISAPK